MSATIIMFPIAAAHALEMCLRGTFEEADVRPESVTVTDLAPVLLASSLATKFADHFLPICQASIDLLEADERDFEARCRRMLDADGTAMIDELWAEFQIVGQQMRILVDGLKLTRTRLQTAMVRLATLTAS